MVVRALPWLEGPVPLRHRGLARISLWAHRTLPISCVGTPGMDVVGEAKAVDEAGLSTFRSLLDQLESYRLRNYWRFSLGNWF